MNPQAVSCPNIDCPARGRTGQGNIGVHDTKDERCMCRECKRPFSATKGAIFYRLHTDPVTVLLVITLLAYGCPTQAIVMAYGFDERKVKKWWRRSGEHCRVVHEHMIEQRQFDLGQVQADEIKAKMQGASVWLAMAIMVSTRLWLGGVVGASRNQDLIAALVAKVRRMALCRPLLLAVDGLVSYVSAFQSTFRSPLPRHGAPGRPRLVAWQGVTIVQVVKRCTPQGIDIVRRIVQGHEALVMRLLKLSQGGGVINKYRLHRAAQRYLPPTTGSSDPARSLPRSTNRHPHRWHVCRRLLLQLL